MRVFTAFSSATSFFIATTSPLSPAPSSQHSSQQQHHHYHQQQASFFFFFTATSSPLSSAPASSSFFFSASASTKLASSFFLLSLSNYKDLAIKTKKKETYTKGEAGDRLLDRAIPLRTDSRAVARILPSSKIASSPLLDPFSIP